MVMVSVLVLVLVGEFMGGKYKWLSERGAKPFIEEVMCCAVR